jgi:hypothetical protein
MRSNDEAWEEIFKELNIAEEFKYSSLFPISAKQINEIGKREARLMAKFDTKESLPALFKKFQLNINAVSNGNYIIFKDESQKSFIKLPDYTTLTPKKFFPSLDYPLDTLQFTSKMSESNAIDYAHHSKMLSSYSGENDLRLTTRGRFFSDAFSFQLGKLGDIDVRSVQIEVDAGYESEKQFLILEAKSSTRDTFNIRQLYYPYRHFQSKTRKEIRTILLSFSNGVYYFTEIAFNKCYYEYTIIGNEAIEVIIPEAIQKVSIAELLSQKTHAPQTIPVPQADDVNKIIDLLSFLLTEPKDKFEIAQCFEFDERQGDYYGNAAAYIGVVKKEGIKFILTDQGVELLKIRNRENRNLKLAELILSTSLFHDLMYLFINQDKYISDVQIISRLAKDGLTGETLTRRKSTAKSWIDWITFNLSL